MEKLRKNVTNIMLVLIIISPFLDSLTYLMRNILQINFSISTLLKPAVMGIIYLIIIVYLFFYKKKKPYYIIPIVLIGIYCLGHLLVVRNMFFSFSHSNFVEETKQMIQIIYLILTLCNFYLLYKYKEDFNFDERRLLRAIAISGVIYYSLYLLSLITNTSALSYSNKMSFGYKGWTNPSHLINHIGVLTLPLVWCAYKKDKNRKWLYAFSIIGALCFGFIGTKSSSIGIIIIIILLLLYELINVLFSFKKEKVFPLFSLIVLLVGCVFSYKYTFTYKNTQLMRSDLVELEGSISEKVDSVIRNVELEGNEENEDPDLSGGPRYNKKQQEYLSNVSKSLADLERITKEKNLSGADNRTNETIYNGILFLRSSLPYKLFGIGFYNQPNNLYMENDIFASLFNYGIIAFLLTYIIFVIIYIYSLVKMFLEFIKGKVLRNEIGYILLISMTLFMILTYTTGYMFYQTSLIIIFVPIFVCSYFYFKSSDTTINVGYRIIKYLSRIARSKNTKVYTEELYYRDKLSIFNYEELSKDMAIAPYELSKDNNLYGIMYALREYSGYKGIIDSYVEHGVNFSNSVYTPQAVNGLSNIITVSDRRIKIYKKHYDKNIYAIGPYIHYATPLYDEAQYKKDKKKLGKVLLVFPSKSIEGVNHSFDSDDFIKEIKNVQKKIKADTVLVNIYYYDIQQGMHKKFEKEGFVIVTAGHKQDIHFTKRLKYIISLADYTMSNNIGTHIGYCLYMNKPHYIYRQNIEIKGDKVDEEFYEERLRTYNESQKEIIEAFDKFDLKITDKQKKIYEEHWNPKNIKSKEEILYILSDGDYNEK